MDNPEQQEPLRILLLEDVPTDAELTLRELRRTGIDFVSRRVETQEQFERAVREFKPDLILSDFSLPASFDGLAALDIARQTLPDVPYIFVSGTIGEDRAVEALKCGATDYVLKDRLNRLVPVIKRALDEAQEHAARHKAEEEVKAQRAFLRQIIDLDRNLIFAKDRQGRFVLVNQAVAEAYGTTVEGLIGKTDADFNPSVEEVEHFRRDDLEVMDTLQEKFIPEERMTDAAGCERWLQTVKRAIVGPDGRADMVLGVATDITERKRQEERIARLSRIHSVLSGINSTIVRVREREELFREACRIAVEEGGFKLAWIGLLDLQTMDIRPGAWIGEEKGLLQTIRLSAHAESPRGAGVSGIAIRTRKPIVVNDVANDGRLMHREETLRAGFRSFVVLPLLVESVPLGALYLYTGETGSFDQDELRLLVELAGDISFALEHIVKQERIDYLAYYDTLTRLPNRTLFQERLNQALLAVRADGGKVGLIALDLQRFGIVNDTLGRHAGDELLKLVAERLSQALTERGWAARISGNTFAIVLPDVRHEADMAHVLEQDILECLKLPFRVGDEELRIAARAGIALFPGDGTDTDSLFRNAEAALKQAKDTGNKYLFYAPQMNARIAETLSLENRLRLALLEDQFVLYYQPKVEIASGRITGLEALLRWRSPEQGVVSPAEFIPLLEETGMILDVGKWVLEQAFADYRAWSRQGLKPPPIAVNISALQLRQEDFAQTVRRVIAQAGDGAPVIDLEITESAVMEDVTQSIAALAAIRQMGSGIAIDDFGTGYSSLSYITRLPVTALKIDRSFVVDMASKSDSMAVASAIISLAHSLNLKVIAEGVETQEQLNLLKLLRCDEMQGYLFSPPLPPEKVQDLLA